MSKPPKYLHQPHAIMLRDMHEAGVSWREMEKTIGYSAPSLFRIAAGVHLPKQRTQTDIEQTWLRWRDATKAAA